MPPPHEQDAESLVVTASLTTDVARAAHGMRASIELIDEILRLEHEDWETTLSVGDVEYHTTRDGPYPNNQMRVSARPSAEVAALNYTDHDDPQMPMANSYNPAHPPSGLYLIFNGETGAVFPLSAVIPMADARSALVEWLRTRRRPTCVKWQRYDSY